MPEHGSNVTQEDSKRIEKIQDYFIRIQGGRDYPEHHWREAILAFLFSMWSGDSLTSVLSTIEFGRVKLTLNPFGSPYSASGISKDQELPPPHIMHAGQYLEVSGSRAEVENGLVRFVKNPKIKTLVLRLDSERLTLWKKQRRGEYGCHLKSSASEL